jgi:NADH-quinone oxidoreductase subunit C
MPDEESQDEATGADEGTAAEKPTEAPTSEGDAPSADAPSDVAIEPEDSRPKPLPGGIADAITTALPDVTLTAYQGMSDVIVEVAREDVPTVMPVLKDNPSLDLKFLSCLFAVDLEADGLEVIYQLASLTKHHKVVIKTKVPHDDPHVASVASVWNAANWHERETRDMFGITFDDHPHLVPLLLPDDMTDHFPLLKSNALAEIEEWQGDALPEEGYGGSKGR